MWLPYVKGIKNVSIVGLFFFQRQQQQKRGSSRAHRCCHHFFLYSSCMNHSVNKQQMSNVEVNVLDLDKTSTNTANIDRVWKSSELCESRPEEQYNNENNNKISNFLIPQ